MIGTNAMEGLTLDAETLALMRQFEKGELTRQELSASIQAHVKTLLAPKSNVPALVEQIVGAA